MRLLILYRLKQSNKTFIPPLRCPICLSIRGKSHTYNSAHSFRYHLTYEHEKQPENFDSISVIEVRTVLSNIIKAQEWGVFTS